MRKQQVAKSQSVRWKRELRCLAAKEVSTALQEQRREYQARPQAHKVGSILESFLFWLSFVFFRAIWIISAAAIEAFREEADTSGSPRLSSTLSSTLPRGTTAGQNGRKYQGPAAVDDEDAVLSQEDRPPGVKNQVPSVTAIAI